MIESRASGNIVRRGVRAVIARDVAGVVCGDKYLTTVCVDWNSNHEEFGMFTQWRLLVLSSFPALAMLALTGCGAAADKAEAPAGADVQAASVDDHSGWWCAEHGVPESECSLCSATAAKKFKEKGDWCEEHNRADSQCFICNPERAEKFVALYEAKFGTKPPKKEEEK
ncbi:MAG: RND transporter [Pirellulales bacterium]